MAIQITVPTGLYDGSGSQLNATYFQWSQVNVQQLPTQQCQITLLGYADKAAYLANPAAPIASKQFNYPVQPTGNPTVDAILQQFPFDPAYIAANYSGSGIGAQMAASQNWVLAFPEMAGATVVS